MGKILDSLSFSLPGLDPITSDPGRGLFEGEVSAELEKGKIQASRYDNLRQFANQALQFGSAVAKPMIQQGRQAAEKAGELAGLQAGFNISGETFEERNKSLQDEFKRMRLSEEIDLIDDPYFQRGLNKVQGLESLRLLDQEFAGAYGRMKNNPTFFRDPDMYETEFRRIYDTVYATLPDSIDAQEGFLSKSRTILDTYNQQYRKDSNQFAINDYITSTEKKIQSLVFDFDLESSLIDESSNGDIGDKWLELTEVFLNKMETGEITEEGLARYIPEDYLDDPVSFFRDAYQNPAIMRSALKQYKWLDTLEDFQQIYDDLYQFGGSDGGLGADPTDLFLGMLEKDVASENAALVMTIINGVQSGTDTLSNTTNGKASLFKLRAINENQAIREKNRLKAEAAALSTEKLANIRIPLADLEARIDTMTDLFAANQGTPQALTIGQIRESVVRDLNKLLRDADGSIIDEDVYFRLLEQIQKNTYRVALKNSTDMKEQDHVSEFTTVINSMGTEPLGPNSQLASKIAFQITNLEAADNSLTRELVENGTRSALNAYITDPQESTASTFWNHVQILKNLNEMKPSSSSKYNVSPMFSNTVLVSSDPGLLRILVQADKEYNALDVFVNPNSDIYKAVRETGQVAIDSNILGTEAHTTIFTGKVAQYQAKRLEKAEAEAKEEDYGFNPERLPIWKESDSDEGTITYGGTRDLALLIDGTDEKTADGLSNETKALLTSAYSAARSKYLSEGYSTLEATRMAGDDFTKRYKFEQIYEQGGFFSSEETKNFKMLIDTEAMIGGTPVQTYFKSIEASLEDVGKTGWSFMESLRQQSSVGQRQVYKAHLEELRANAKTRLVEQGMEEFPKVLEGLRKNRETFTPKTYTALVDLVYNAESVTQPTKSLITKAISEYITFPQGVTERPPMSEKELTGLAKYIAESIKAQTPGMQLGEEADFTNPARVEQFLYSIDKKGTVGLNVFDPQFEIRQRQEYRRDLEEEFTDDTLYTQLVARYGETAAKAFVSEESMMRAFSEFSLDTDNFNFAGEDFAIIPVEGDNYGFQDEDGQILNYSNKKPFLFTLQDLGEKVQQQQKASVYDIWAKVGPQINPKVKQVVTEEQLYEELSRYYEDWPKGLEPNYFYMRFGRFGQVLYKAYKKYNSEE